jgi:nicotinate-nucleotide adenylyltransferase
MAPFAARLAQAKREARSEPHVVASAIEAELGSRYTADTLKLLRRRFPHHRFVWLMGGDNLAQIRRWRRWPEIFATVPVAVFARPASTRAALAGMAAERFARARIAPRRARRLAEREPPAWAFFPTRLDRRSATEIRSQEEASIIEEAIPGPAEPSVITAWPAKRPGSRPVRPRRAPTVPLHELILSTLADGKAEEIVTIELAGKTTIADQMVVASGRSTRQVIALADHLVAALAGYGRVSVEGKAQGDWVLIDAGDVIVHLFRPETRAFYNLEKMWGTVLPTSEAAG